jgi:hypothetical protein
MLELQIPVCHYLTIFSQLVLLLPSRGILMNENGVLISIEGGQGMDKHDVSTSVGQSPSTVLVSSSDFPRQTFISMCSLLSLPRELRDQIIEHVVLFRKAPPEDPAQCLQSRVESSGGGTLRLPSRSQETYNASGLLRTSRQIRDETRHRLRQLNPPYSLDVMIGDNELWPTWTCCPIRSSGPIDTVNVTLRFFSKPDDPFMVHVARTVRAVLRGRKWSSTSLHPLAELFLHIRDVCLRPGTKEASTIETLCFDVHTMGQLDHMTTVTPTKSPSSVGLKSLFGKHRSLWNSFRSIHQYPFGSDGDTKTLEVVASLKIMVILFLQEAWEDDCAVYNNYVGPLGAAFRSVQSLNFLVDGHDIGQLTSRVLSS